MLSLAMNDRSHTFAGIFAHPFPNTHDVAASRVHDLATTILYLLENGDLSAERGQNHDIIRAEFGNVCLFVSTSQVLNSKGGDLLVYLGVMNDLADDK